MGGLAGVPRLGDGAGIAGAVNEVGGGESQAEEYWGEGDGGGCGGGRRHF